MATIDIGKLTFTHKGDYAGGTAYVANDVVYYNGSAYIAKTSTTGNLPTSTAHWNTFAAGSGGIWNAGLSLGSAGQVVKVNSGATALEFGTVSSDYVKLATATGSNAATIGMDGFFSSDYKRYIIMGRGIRAANSSAVDFQWRYNTGGSVDTSSSYVQTNWYSYTDTSPSHSINASNPSEGSIDVDSPATRFEFNGDDFTDDEDTGADLTIELFDPQASNKWKNAKGQIWYVRNDKNTIQNWNQYAVFKSTTATTGVTFQMRNGNIYGTFDLYGIKA